MKKVVERERNKDYYRVLHVPIWIWVFFVLPGHLTFDLYTHGPDVRHAIWLAVVTAVCAWRAWVGRLPGCEPKPYIIYWGVAQENLPYRMVCYTAAWIALVVPYLLNLIGMVIAVINGRWMIAELYQWLYYPLALAIVAMSFADLVPRARRTTLQEGAERAWFYVGIWTIVPAQVAGWAMWRLGSRFEMNADELAWARLGVTVAVTIAVFTLAYLGIVPRTARYYVTEGEMAQAAAADD